MYGFSLVSVSPMSGFFCISCFEYVIIPQSQVISFGCNLILKS